MLNGVARPWKYTRKGRPMSQFKINNVLRPEDREALHAFLLDPGKTIAYAKEWLVGRGYQISRCAVARYRVHLRTQPDAILRQMVRGATAAELRAQLLKTIEGMGRSELVALAAIAAFWTKLRGRG
jgi:hypothetical protein